uniref:Candidate secreted effector n=1 Tax=Meloidogyne incognita TaxID=6306 RepID=A0A914L2E9_MELIC
MKNNVEGSEFVKIYKHFIVFSCITEEEAGQENFCGFLENLDKINEKIEKINQTEIHHIGLKTEDCPTEIQKIKNEEGQQFDFEEKEESENVNFCTSWLVGIKGKDEFMDKDLLKFEIEESVKTTGVTEDLKIFVILQEEIENWGFEVNQDVELM